jgi:hypothetical protein
MTSLASPPITSIPTSSVDSLPLLIHTTQNVQMQIERARRELALLEEVHRLLQDSKTPPTFEAVVPESHPNNGTFKAFGSNIDNCVAEARRKAGRRDLAFVYLNVTTAAGATRSIAIDPKDSPTSEIKYDHEDGQLRFNVVWDTQRRGSAWLV